MKILILIIIFTSIQVFSKEVPIEHFAAKAQFNFLRISPDGNHVAYIYDDEGQSKLAIMNLKTKKGIYSFDAGSHRELSYIWWLNNKRVIVLSSKITGWLDGKPKFYEMVGLNINGKNREAYSNFNVVSELKSDPKNFIVSRRYYGENLSLFKFDFTTGQKSYLTDIPKPQGREDAIIFHVASDLKDEPRIALEYDPKEEDNFNDDVYRLHIKNLKGEWEIIDFPSVNKGEVTYRIAGMNHSNDLLYFISDFDLVDGGTLGLFSYNFKTKKIEKLFRHNDVDIQGVITAANGAVIGVSYDAGYRNYYYVSDPLAKNEIAFHQSIRASFKNQNIQIVNYTADNNKLIIFVYSDKNPGKYYIFDKKLNKAEYFASTQPNIKSNQMASVEPFTLNARDGLKMYGLMTIPNNKELKKLPMVIYPHGGPYGLKDSWRWDERAQLLASRGYLVVQLDFRGSGGYGTVFEQEGHFEWGAKMQDDLTDATLWAVNQGYADQNRICIHGISYGGYAAMQALVKEPDLYKCAIADAGIYDIDLQWKKADSFYGGGYNKEKNHYLKQMLGSNFEEKMSKMSPAQNVDKIKGNILLVHGKQDIRVPIANAKLLEKKLKKVGKEYDTFYKKDGHGFSKIENRVDLYKKMLSFLDENIGSKND